MAEFIDFFNIFIMGSVEVLLQFYFLAVFLKKKVRLVFSVLFAAGAAAVIHFIQDSTVTGFGVHVVLLTVGGILICRADVKSSLFYASLTTEIMTLCYGIVNSLSGMLYLPLLDALPESSGIVWMVAGQAVSLLFTGTCYAIVERYFSRDILSPADALSSAGAERPACTAAEMQYLFLVFIPILMIFIMNDYINSLEYSIEVVVSAGPAEYLFSHGQMLFMQLLGLASLFCILYAYKKLLQGFWLRTKISLSEQEEYYLNQYVEEAKSRYEKTKSFRHDIRNHISVVKELLENGKTNIALDYIVDMEEMAKELSFACSTGHPVADILLGNKLGLAESMGIDVSCSLVLPYPCGLRDIDLCIVLSNALDNAIHACKGMDGTGACICISGRIQGDFLMLEFENPFQGDGPVRRGTGLSNIKSVAEKYGGTMNVEIRENIFALQVLFILPQQQNDAAVSSGQKTGIVP